MAWHSYQLTGDSFAGVRGVPEPRPLQLLVLLVLSTRTKSVYCTPQPGRLPGDSAVSLLNSCYIETK